MRHIFLIFVFIVIAVTLRAEAPLPSGEFAKSSLADAEKAVVAAEANPALLADYAVAAVESKRSDLAMFCFENSRIAYAFDDAVSKLPDSPYKEELMLKMLKSPSSYWNRLPDFSRYPGYQISASSAPFRALIKKYLPNTPIDDSLVSTHESRSKLADRIEAIKNPKPQAQGESKVKVVELVDASQPHPSAPPAPPVSTATPSSSSPAPTVAESPAPAVGHRSPVWPWLVGIAALAVIALLVWKRRA